MAFMNLQKKIYWSRYYSHEKNISEMPKTGFFGSYDIYLCDTIVKQNIPKPKTKNNTNPKICEIGSGDGKLLVKFAKMFNFIPYGIENSRDAALKSQSLGVQTIICDAFSKSIIKKYLNYFDIVFSYGFIEHILPPERAIKLHIDLAKPGGYVIIQIPRFKGFNWWRIKFFRPDLIKAHNMNIMEAKTLNRLCTEQGLKKVFCGNYGTFRIRIPMDKRDYKFYLLKILYLVEYLLNPILYRIFRDKGFETNFFSPAVMFIGRKKK